MININLFCSSSFHSPSPDPFNSPKKKIKTEPILRDIMGNGKKMYGSVLYEGLSPTALSGFHVLQLNFRL